MARDKDNTNEDGVTADAEATTTDTPSGDVEITTDAPASTGDLSAGIGVGDVSPEDIPNALEASNLPPEVRADLVSRHPVTPGAQPAPATVREQPMPIVTGLVDGSEVNDQPIVYFTSDAHPELVVWHPNGGDTIQFHNGRFGTANAEWQAVLERTPEVSRVREETRQGGPRLDEKGHVPPEALVGADVEPVRTADVQG